MTLATNAIVTGSPRAWLFAALALALAPLAFSQNAPPPQDATFEVASMRRTAPGFSFMTMDGEVTEGRIRYTSMSLRNLLSSAYGVGYDFVVGPGWIDEVRLDIAATFPRGTTKQQFRSMLRHLLEERLKLVAHMETKQSDGYALVVAESGPRLSPSVVPTTLANQPAAPDQSANSPTRDEDGFPLQPSGPGVQETCVGTVCRFRATEASMPELAERLPCRCSIVDQTRLGGKYAFVLTGNVQRLATPDRTETVAEELSKLNSTLPAIGATLPAAPNQTVTDIFTALRSQLGLKLERKKVPTPVLHVDSCEKVPTEN